MTVTDGPAARGTWRMIAWTLAVGAAVRLLLFLFALYQPIANETGQPVSPAHYQQGADYHFYMTSRQSYAAGGDEVISTIRQSLDIQYILERFADPTADLYHFVLSGPLLPLLLSVFDYAPGNTLPLSIFSLAVGLLITAVWLVWISRTNLNYAWLFLFILLPNPIWYQLNNSADHYFFLIFTLFFAVYFSDAPSSWRVPVSIALALALCLTKPNGLPVLIFLLIDQVGRRSSAASRQQLALHVGLLLLVICAGVLFYAGYFAAFMKSSLGFEFFGIAYKDYLTGLFPALPKAIDMPLSWLVLFGVKVLHLVGIRPSWGITPDALVLVRAAPGLILLPGLIWLLVRGDRRIAALVVLFILPPLLGATQERYILPIQPILFIYGAMAYEAGFRALRRRMRRASRSASPGSSGELPHGQPPSKSSAKGDGASDVEHRQIASG